MEKNAGRSPKHTEKTGHDFFWTRWKPVQVTGTPRTNLKSFGALGGNQLMKKKQKNEGFLARRLLLFKVMNGVITRKLDLVIDEIYRPINTVVRRLDSESLFHLRSARFYWHSLTEVRAFQGQTHQFSMEPTGQWVDKVSLFRPLCCGAFSLSNLRRNIYADSLEWSHQLRWNTFLFFQLLRHAVVTTTLSLKLALQIGRVCGYLQQLGNQTNPSPHAHVFFYIFFFFEYFKPLRVKTSAILRASHVK